MMAVRRVSQRGDDNHVLATGGRYLGADHRLGGVIATLENDVGLERRDQFHGVSSPKHATPSTKELRQHGGALISFCIGRVLPFRRRTESSPLSPTTSLSQDEAYASTDEDAFWWRRSKQPLAPIRWPSLRQSSHNAASDAVQTWRDGACHRDDLARTSRRCRSATTTPAAMFASFTASASDMPPASAAPIMAMTVSSAPETSNTSRVFAGLCPAAVLVHKQHATRAQRYEDGSDVVASRQCALGDFSSASPVSPVALRSCSGSGS